MCFGASVSYASKLLAESKGVKLLQMMVMMLLCC